MPNKHINRDRLTAGFLCKVVSLSFSVLPGIGDKPAHYVNR